MFQRSAKFSKNAYSFDLGKWKKALFFSINKQTLTSLYTHLDGIALEIFGSVQEEPRPELLQQLFQRFLEVSQPLVRLVPLSSNPKPSSLEVKEDSEKK